MRFLIISTPFTGHISPSFNMAKALIDMGHEVCYITAPQWEPTIQKVGADIIPYENNEKLSVMIADAYKTVQSVGSSYDAIIYDELFFPGRVLGESFNNKPTVRFFPCVAIDRQIMERMIHGHGFMGIFRTSFIRKRWTKTVCKDLIPGIDDWTEEVVSNAPDCNIVFVPDWFQPRLPDFAAGKYCFAGPSVYDDSGVSLPDWITGSKQPIIYISLGTIDNKQLRFYKQCLQIFSDKNARFILSVGNKIPAERLGDIPPNCTVYSHAPQKKILEYADLFVTHGGMNSVNEAMLQGVPMLVLPISNDQPVNAEQIAALGIGKMFDIKRLTGLSLWGTISEMLNDEVLLARVNDMKYKINNTGGEIAAKTIIAYVNAE